ncbi:coxsackievirus and adenovirus receptor-like [Solea senegalensis]|uniref:Coxsackievirus and adenovirus receptor-like n=1 Tax=Solea senegalensis TaxID=28829 RepID=A0AAV6QVE8_SOLSE|nr:butyrophilin subfamily 1 member A1-like isoform X1 [Solea senegalensis]XP_043876651.1 butyrophilin subfamily 1 member A1-like isoform X2 [Solea senegalensis]XP_043876652.1 butyrophilin subfamily 1 member A1-like isoform X3 [Solea senegalensis]KAG7497309.1 coxsackievirus and adenovirus receptor-like [Solea senegalensis]
MSQYLRDILFVSLALVIDGLEELTVMSGRDATLQSWCSSNGEVTLIEWTRSDLQPLKYVFLYRNARSYGNYQNPGYRGRVELRNPEIKDGDVSITVKNVSVDDAGLYKCRTIVKENGNSTEFRRDINLRVTDSGQTQQVEWSEESKVRPANIQFLKKNENTPMEMVDAGAGADAGVVVAAVAPVVAVVAIVAIVGIVKSEKCLPGTVV